MPPRWLKPTDPARRLAQRDAPAALALLREVLNNKSTSNKDRIAAAKALLQFSGPVEIPLFQVRLEYMTGARFPPRICEWLPISSGKLKEHPIVSSGDMFTMKTNWLKLAK
jgi:hypothetical protein